MQTIAVTGGSGKLGTWVIEELISEGYRVVSIDEKSSDRVRCKQLKVNLSDFGQVVGALQGADAIIHLAAIPAPIGFTNETIFSNNVRSAYNVLEAASALGIRKVVIGSSESAYGFCWSPEPFSPDFVPVDESHPLVPRECYGLSKAVAEQSGEMFSRRDGMRVMALRYAMIVAPHEYKGLTPGKPERYYKMLWSYVDIRDAVQATLAALRSEAEGFHALNIAADDSLCDQPSERILDDYHPEIAERRGKLDGRAGIVSNEKAKRVLGWKPSYSWEQYKETL
ncbi:NAD(P)-dependent oxidoreductase [Cohnella endophytica]|uniref:NAD(P)-dependent oxidoreductase n=1 Tax=Cohnella endophytica TaxID=2419778 RepID=A0A494XYA0_9BACL|nr:NAD(P)-dependent oxidoreductase [Cohnella endophytica]RKP53064.1 NAD(P)-dependent oxidoreductase [Cohnella endophytica]